MQYKKIELMVGVGWWESLNAAASNGADSIYFGIKQFNLRANARSFELNEIKKITLFCHSHNIKAYLALNSIVYDDEYGKIKHILNEAAQAGIDGIIAWDFAVINEALKQKLEVHLSTQASASNYQTIKHYANNGIKQVVLARELNLKHIQSIYKKLTKDKLDLKLEAFIHGAMCISISGRCFISEFLFNRSANRGDCLQPCRRKYKITDLEENKEMQIEDGYILSPKDLCTIGIIDKILDAGIYVCKIEGRTRPSEYVAVTTSVYRNAIDDYLNGNLSLEKKDFYLKKLKNVYNRGFSNGFYLGQPLNDLAELSGSAAVKQKKYIGEITHYFQNISVAEINIRNDELKENDRILICGKTTGAREMQVRSLQLNNKQIKKGLKGEKVAFKTDFRVRKNDKVFLYG